MKLSKLIGYGILIWIVIFAVGWIISFISINLAPIYYSVVIFIAAIVSFSLARTLNLSSGEEILKYSFTWALIDVILTYAIILIYSPVPISQNFFTALSGVFSTWSIVEYLAILLVPLFAAKSK